MRSCLRPIAFLALAAASLVPAVARAGLADCGNVDVSADATCTVKTSCSVECTPVSFNAACAGKLEASCESQCNLPTVNCSASCESDCAANCTAKQGSFSCEGDCRGTCEGTCAGKCTAAADQAECTAQCQATCGGECQASCQAEPATVDCTGQCQASCQGSCKADLNMDCQTQCQANGFGSCKANLQGGCTAQCESPDGAVFCDGQFVDNGGHAQQCVDALKAYLASHVVATASGSSSCDNGTCQAQGKASVSCQFAPASGGFGGEGAVLAGLALAAGVVRRRRSSP